MLHIIRTQTLIHLHRKEIGIRKDSCAKELERERIRQRGRRREIGGSVMEAKLCTGNTSADLLPVKLDVARYNQCISDQNQILTGCM